MKDVQELRQHSADLCDYFDNKGIGPIGALAVIGLFASTLMSEMDQKVFDSFKAALDASYNFSKRTKDGINIVPFGPVGHA